jgi:hypothetical protein
MSKRMQRATKIAKWIFEKGFTPYPRRDAPRMVKGRKTKKKKAFNRPLSHQRVPFVERTPLMRVFRVTASRKARAKALKIASAM